jgi:glycosyltransferase involved in cell wall biosynthesis
MATSVCMATYNGEKYVLRQLQSILDQLSPDDEVIVVDDCSTDRTVDVIKAMNDPRVATYVNDRNRREVYSFGRAIALARHRFIFLSDQDDVWLPGRVALMSEALKTALLATSNFEWIDQDEHPLRISHDGVRPEDSNRYFKNIADIFIGKTTYFGCAMAFRRELKPLLLPIPDYIESHDWWVALAGNMARSNVHLRDKTFLKRRHGNNATDPISSRSLASRLRSRAILLRSMLAMEKRRRELNISAAAAA